MQFNFLNCLRGWTGKITHFFLFAVVFFLLSINFGTVEAQEGDLYVASGANHKVVSYNGTTGALICAFFTAGSGRPQGASRPDV
jgi:hypothetical protein